jgi:uncharacterized protein
MRFVLRILTPSAARSAEDHIVAAEELPRCESRLCNRLDAFVVDRQAGSDASGNEVPLSFLKGSHMAGKDLIRYDLLVQDALKGVVRRVLIDAGKDGLPGEHHFYISFRTDFPGVRLSNRLREKYPQEMTIVLQHQFWDLGVTEHAFEIGLSFSGVPERLLIPFDALTGFFDPSVQFGLKFESQDEDEDEIVETAPPVPVRTTDSAPVELKKPSTPPAEKKSDPQKIPASASPKAAPAKAATEQAPGSPEPGAAGSAEVVSLDAFRKKN